MASQRSGGMPSPRARAASISDIALNTVGLAYVQGAPLSALSLGDFLCPVDTYVRTNFITGNAVAGHMVRQKAGVILTLSTPHPACPGRAS
ncbi:hypothetical protein P3W85_00930 [Cupriavidus basilensis]|uniref:Uncharacterized protein n=1 Tax=Cupriavidus basilensis TaxID=68895 RepID=A0ABT6AG03_9BURK|nr:hypothetical protein [Cupriavidus basilensis]MDF3831532.1 hypothetical protein [Cupriavidus basilensis]